MCFSSVSGKKVEINIYKIKWVKKMNARDESF